MGKGIENKLLLFYLIINAIFTFELIVGSFKFKGFHVNSSYKYVFIFAPLSIRLETGACKKQLSP